MSESPEAYIPEFSYTHEMVRHLMEIEGACRLVDVLPLPTDAAFMLKHEAQRHSTRFSTAIEGNTTPLEEISREIALTDRTDSQRQQEVRNYWMALDWLDRQVEANARLSEDFIRRLHRIIIIRGKGRRGEKSEYRTEECPVVDARTGQIDYGPPRPEDLPTLMKSLVAWRNSPAAAILPGPVRAAILAHRFVTIHPFMDGNGRTARALATAELWFSGYRMRDFLSMEEEYFRDLRRYYDSLQMELPIDYYAGRCDPDLTPWLTYFLEMMAAAATRLSAQALDLGEALRRPTAPWEALNRLQQQLLSRLLRAEPERVEVPTFTTRDLAEWFMISEATGLQWLRDWSQLGFVEPASGRQRVRSWRVVEQFQQLVAYARSTLREAE